MTQFTKRSFSVAMTIAGGEEQCKTKGHSALDAKGRCLCCGEQIRIVEITPNEFVGPPLTPWQRQFVKPKDGVRMLAESRFPFPDPGVVLVGSAWATQRHTAGQLPPSPSMSDSPIVAETGD